MKISDIVERLNHKNQVVEILRLDLHGGEWDVLHTLLTSSIVMVIYSSLVYISLVKFGLKRKKNQIYSSISRILNRSSLQCTCGMGKNISMW